MALTKPTKKPARTTRSARQAASEEGPRYRALADSYIDNVYYTAGKELVYYGVPGSQLLALNEEAKARKRAVRDIRLDKDLDADGKLEALRELSDEWNGVEVPDSFLDGEANLDSEANLDDTGRIPNRRNVAPLPDAERAELEKHAQATVDASREAERDDTNLVRVKLQGHLDDANNPSALQGNTPVLDKGAAGKAGKAKTE